MKHRTDLFCGVNTTIIAHCSLVHILVIGICLQEKQLLQLFASGELCANNNANQASSIVYGDKDPSDVAHYFQSKYRAKKLFQSENTRST